MLNTIAIRLILGIILFIIGMYLFICAVRVKGFVYINTPLQDTKYYDKYVKFVRVCCFVLPAIFSVNLVLSSMSFASCYKYQTAYLQNADYEILEKLNAVAETQYGAATLSLVASLFSVIIMLLIIAVITGALTSGVRKEKLSEAAFKKNKDK